MHGGTVKLYGVNDDENDLLSLLSAVDEGHTG